LVDIIDSINYLDYLNEAEHEQSLLAYAQQLHGSKL